MKINFHDLETQYQLYKPEIDAALSEVLNSCQFIMGKEVVTFEQNLARYLECQHVISCASGTDALFLSLLAIDVQPGDEVITTPFSFIATAEVIALLGAKPVFVDIEEDTYNLDPNKLESKITEKTRAIIPVSLYGQPAEIEPIQALAKTYSQRFDKKIYVIEDAAQSLGAEYKGKKSGNLCDMGCLSFFPSKPLGCYGDGGAIVVNDDILAEKIKSLRVHGQTKRYNHKYIGFNCRLDTLQAAILNVKLSNFDEEVEKRHKIANYYFTALHQLDVVLPYIKPERTSVFAQFSIRVKDRSLLIEHLQKHHIPTAIHYPKPLHLQECFSHLNYQAGDFPIAEQTSAEILSLPMSAFLTEVQLKYIVNTMNEFFESESISQVS